LPGVEEGPPVATEVNTSCSDEVPIVTLLFNDNGAYRGDPPPLAGGGEKGGSGRYEAVDLAVAEEPGSVLFDQLVAIGST